MNPERHYEELKRILRGGASLKTAELEYKNSVIRIHSYSHVRRLVKDHLLRNDATLSALALFDSSNFKTKIEMKANRSISIMIKRLN